MQFTKTSNYAVNIICYLAECGERRNATIISEKLGIPVSYVFKVAAALKKAGMIAAVEGTDGGYYLIKTADKISLLDILATTERTMKVSYCLEENAECESDVIESCSMRKFYAELQQELDNKLGNTYVNKLILCK